MHARSGQRPAAHGAYHEPRTGPAGASARRHRGAAGRKARRCGADHPCADGPAAAGRDDRPRATDPLGDGGCGPRSTLTMRPVPMRGTCHRLVVSAAILIAINAAVAAQETPPTLDTIEQSIENERARAEELERQSQALAAELATLRQQQIETAAAMQDHEERLTAFDDSMQALADGIAVIEQRLASGRLQSVATLAALQRIALTPPESAIFSEGDPIDRARAAALLEHIYPRLAAQAARMRADLDDLAAMQASIADQQRAAAETATALAAENETLASLAARKEALLADTEEERSAAEQRIGQLAEEAEDLRDLIARLAEGPPAAKPAETEVDV